MVDPLVLELLIHRFGHAPLYITSRDAADTAHDIRRALVAEAVRLVGTVDGALGIELAHVVPPVGDMLRCECVGLCELEDTELPHILPQYHRPSDWPGPIGILSTEACGAIRAEIIVVRRTWPSRANPRMSRHPW